TLEIDLQRAIEGELKGPIFCLTHRHSTSAPPLIASKPTSVNDSARSYHTSSTPGKWKSGSKAFSEPHFGHLFSKGLPHSAQNFLPVLLSVPHFVQSIASPCRDKGSFLFYHSALARHYTAAGRASHVFPHPVKLRSSMRGKIQNASAPAR